MRKLLIPSLVIIAACGGSSKTKNPDAPNNIDSPGSGTDSGSGTPTTITVTVGAIPTTPANSYIAFFQDGTGPWQIAPAPSAGVYTLTIDSATWGFGYACDASVAVTGTNPGSATAADVILYEFTVAERTSLTTAVAGVCRDPSTTPPFAMVMGTVTGLTLPGTYTVTFGGSHADVGTVTTGSGSFTLTNVAPAKRELFITHFPIVVAGSGNGGVADMVYRSPTNVDELMGSAITVDWGTAGSAIAATQTMSATGANTINYVTQLYTKSGTDPVLSNNPLTSAFLASTQMGSNDIYEQDWTVDAAADYAETWVTTPTVPALPTPAPLSGITVTESATTPYPILTTSWAAYTNANAYEWAASESLGGGLGSNGGSLVTWANFVSQNFIGANPSFVMPDFSTLTGWVTGEQFTGGSNDVNVVVQAFQTSGGIDDFPFANPSTAGTTRERAGYAATKQLQ